MVKSLQVSTIIPEPEAQRGQARVIEPMDLRVRT